MRLFIFKSESRRDLHAFTGDAGGSLLPQNHGPWSATGIVGATSDPPHRMSREVIEAAIGERGFQLWRMTSKQQKQAVAS